MVRLRTFLVIVLVALPLTTGAITPEELARLSEKGAADKRRAAKELDLEDLRYPVQLPQPPQLAPANKARAAKTVSPTPAIETGHEPAAGSESEDVELAGAEQKSRGVETAIPQASPPGPSPVSSKYARSQGRTPHPQNVRQLMRQQRDHSAQASWQGSRTARAPSQASIQRSLPGNTATGMPTKAVYYSDAVEVDTARYYGIRRGSWIKAELRRNINSAEPGDVELTLTHDVHGDKKTLASGTQLFAEKGYTAATQRMDMISTYAITPDGREFTLKARIYDTRKISGLAGIVDVDESKLTDKATSQALASLGGSVLDEVGGQSIIGRGIAKGGQSMINDGQRATLLQAKQPITIFVAPQPVLLRVEETF